MSLSVGTRLGPYDLVAPLGVGGLGEVYRVGDPELGHGVALAILPDACPHDRERPARARRPPSFLRR